MWKPEDFGWLSSDIVNVWYKGLYELRLDRNRPGVYICRKKVMDGNVVKILVKFYQYIPKEDVEFAKKLLDVYLYPSSAEGSKV